MSDFNAVVVVNDQQVAASTPAPVSAVVAPASATPSTPAVAVRNANGAYNPATNPLRRPAWRWDRISYLTNKTNKGYKRAVNSFDDQLVITGRNYLLQYINLTKAVVQQGSQCDLDSAFAAAYTQWPDLSMAHRIYVTSSFARWAIEALILANQTAEDIAGDLGCPPSVVTTYETYFYDVRDRMKSELFIIDALMSPAMKSGMGSTDFDFFWKGLAYWYGAPVLKAAWSMGVIPDDIKNQLSQCMTAMMDRNTLRATVARQPNQYNAHDILDEHLTAKQIDANTKYPGDLLDVKAKEGSSILVRAIQLSAASRLLPGTTGIETRAAYTIHEMAAAVLSTDKPLDIPQDPLKSAFDRPKADVNKSERVQESVSPDVLSSIHEKKNLILDRIKSKTVGK